MTTPPILKTAALVLAGAAAGAGGTKLAAPATPARSIHVHAVDLRQTFGSTAVQAHAYATATTTDPTTKASTTVDLGGHACPLAKDNAACAARLMADSAVCFGANK